MAPFFTGITRGIGGAGFGKRSGGGAVAFSVTGGDVANRLAPGNGYLYHTFSTPGSLVVATSKTVELLMVAGGGGSAAGGGGAGGLLYHPSLTLSTGTYTVTVGSGGLGYDSVSVPAATPGGDTILSYPTFTATTKGGGGDGLPGGSGGSAYGSPYGWGTYNPAAPNTTQPTFPQPGLPPGYLQYGNSTGLSMFYSGGGGGGAGGIGGNSTATGYINNSNNPTPGGIGRQYLQFLGPLIGIPPLNPHNGYFAGGGGSGSGRDGWVNNAESGQIGTGGAGGGGNGGSHSGGQANNDHTAGVNYLGGGGGGSSSYPQNYPGKNGGSGILCIRYLAS
jgi:hypothetical protein